MSVRAAPAVTPAIRSQEILVAQHRPDVGSPPFLHAWGVRRPLHGGAGTTLRQRSCEPLRDGRTRVAAAAVPRATRGEPARSRLGRSSTRGAHGGYELARDPALIRMGEVVTALEGPIAPMVCASQDPHPAEMCERVGYCTVDRLWRRVRDAVVAALDSTTLEELAQPRSGHPAHPGGRPSHSETALVAVRPLRSRPAKEPIAQP